MTLPQQWSLLLDHLAALSNPSPARAPKHAPQREPHTLSPIIRKYADAKRHRRQFKGETK